MKKNNISSGLTKYLMAFPDISSTLTVDEITERVGGVSKWAVYRGLRSLIEKGYIREGEGQRKGKRGRPIKVYSLTEKGLRIRRVLGGGFSIDDVLLMLKPVFAFLEEKNIARSIGVLERFLNDSRRSLMERKIALCLWIFYLMVRVPEVLIMPDVASLRKAVQEDVLLSPSGSPTFKAKVFIGLIWVVLPYITNIRRLIHVPDDVLLSDDEIVSYIAIRWEKVEDFIRQVVEKESRG